MCKLILKLFLIFTTILLASSSKIQSKKCAQKPVDFTINGVNYFYNGFLKDFTDKREVSWSVARGICKSYCSDLMSMDTEREFREVKKFLEDNLIDYMWTSGHICEKNQCDSNSHPLNINGWLWSDKNLRMPPTDRNPPGWSFNPWSHTGYNKEQQPDNAEQALNGHHESCMAILHNVYDDGIKFHDVACYHKKNFICEG